MKVQIGLFGFGVVGQGFHNILAQKNGTAPGRVARICVRDRAKPRPLSAEHYTFDPEDIFGDPAITHIVEATDRPDDAFRIVQRALLQGKTVISANKKMLAERLPELLDLQQRTGSRLLYEASVGGSIPIFRNLEQFYAHDEVRGIRGVLNGSTNFILTRMMDEGWDFQTALAFAQRLGFAESDPSLDVDAHDPAYKLVLLIHRAFGKILTPTDVFRIGIRHVTADDLVFARQRGYKIRLLATAAQTPAGGVTAYVVPTLVPQRDPFFNLENEDNAVQVQALFTGNQLLTGKGAGSVPTGFAVLSDLVASVATPGQGTAQHAPRVSNDLRQEATVYWRCPTKDLRNRLAFSEILEESHLENGFWVLGRLRLEELAQQAAALNASGSFVGIAV